MTDILTGRDAAQLIEEIVEDLAELVILAEYAGRDHCPRAKAYKIEIDRIHKTVHEHGMIGGNILGLVGKDPDLWALQMKLHGGRRVRIRPDEFIEFHAHKIERFETSPKRVRNGEVSEKEVLSQDDTDFLNSLALSWGILIDGAAKALLIHDYPLPIGASHDQADMLIRIPDLYPAAGLDMFNLPPGVGRKDNRALPNLSEAEFQGVKWVQWSRHRDQGDPWRPDVDCIATHLAFVDNALIGDLS